MKPITEFFGGLIPEDLFAEEEPPGEELLTGDLNLPPPSLGVLTPDGLKDISELEVGDEVIGFDRETGTQVVNTIQAIEEKAPEQYRYWELDETGAPTVEIVEPFLFYTFNGTYTLFKDQSVFANGRVVHASGVAVGDTIYDAAGQEIRVETIAEDDTRSAWRKVSVSGNHTYIADGVILHNASRYWVGGGSNANWNATGPTNWGSASDTQDNASVPSSSDDVFFDGVGTGASNSTLSASISINSLDMTGYANTLTHNSSVTLTITGNTLKFSPEMTYTLGSVTTSALSFTSTTGTSDIPTTPSTAGKTVGNVTINGNEGYFSLQDSLANGSGATLTLTAGAFDANDQDVTIGRFSSSNSNTRTITPGAGTWTITGNGATVWTTSTITNLTITTRPTLNFNYSDEVGTRTITTGALAESVAPNINITAGTDIIALITAMNNVNFTGFSGTLNNGARTLYGNLTISPEMSLNAGTSVTTFAATSGMQTITSNGKTLDFPITINAPDATVRLADDLTIGDIRTLTLTAGTLHIPNGIECNVPAGITNNGTLLIDSDTWIIYGSLTNNPGGTINFNGSNIHAKKTFVQNGTFDLSGKTLTFDGAGSALHCSGELGGTVVVSLTSGDFANSSGCIINLSTTSTIGAHLVNSGTINILGNSWNVQNLQNSPTALATLSTMGADMPESVDKWRGTVLGQDGKIYGIPYSATDFLIIDPEAGTAARSDMGADLSGTSKWIGGVFGNDGKIYGIPYSATDFLIIDPEAGTAARSDMGADLSGSNKWAGGVLGNNGKIYGIPLNATDILIIDPEAGTATRSDMGADLSGSNKWQGGVLGNDGKIYGIPLNATDILIIDPEAGTATRSDMGADLSGPNKLRGALLGQDGKIYGIPLNATDILIIDPEAGTATRSILGAAISTDPGKYYQISKGATHNGKLYVAPALASSVLVIDPNSTYNLVNYGTINHQGDSWSVAGNFVNYGTVDFNGCASNFSVTGEFTDEGTFTTGNCSASPGSILGSSRVATQTEAVPPAGPLALIAEAEEKVRNFLESLTTNALTAFGVENGTANLVEPGEDIDTGVTHQGIGASPGGADVDKDKPNLLIPAFILLGLLILFFIFRRGGWIRSGRGRV